MNFKVTAHYGRATYDKGNKEIKIIYNVNVPNELAMFWYEVHHPNIMKDQDINYIRQQVILFAKRTLQMTHPGTISDVSNFIRYRMLRSCLELPDAVRYDKLLKRVRKHNEKKITRRNQGRGFSSQR